MQLASAILARHADALADQMKNGTLDNRNGPEALRLLATVMRFATSESGTSAGRARHPATAAPAKPPRPSSAPAPDTDQGPVGI